MAQGNVFMVIPASERAKKVPTKLVDALGWEEITYDDEGNVIERSQKRPMWDEVGERFRSRFGEIRTVEVNGESFTVIEHELSFIKGEVQEMVKLQKANKKDFFLLTRTEAERWLAGEDVFQ